MKRRPDAKATAPCTGGTEHRARAAVGRGGGFGSWPNENVRTLSGTTDIPSDDVRRNVRGAGGSAPYERLQQDFPAGPGMGSGCMPLVFILTCEWIFCYTIIKDGGGGGRGGGRREGNEQPSRGG